MDKLGFFRKLWALFFGWWTEVLPSRHRPNVYAIVHAQGLADNGGISKAGSRCLCEAITLYLNGFVKTICLTGGNKAEFWGFNPQSDHSEMTSMQEFLDKLHLEEEIPLLTEGGSVNTLENIGNIIDQLSPAELRDAEFVLVTHPLHLGRAVAIGQKLGLKVWAAPIKPVWDKTCIPKFMRGPFRFFFRNALASVHHLLKGWV